MRKKIDKLKKLRSLMYLAKKQDNTLFLSKQDDYML